MFTFIRSELRNKLLLLLSCNSAIIVLAVYFGFSSLSKVIDTYGFAVSNDVSYMARVASLNIQFKTQVQEWKNTLIRGHDQNQLDKYWSRFNDSADKIETQYPVSKTIENFCSGDQPSERLLPAKLEPTFKYLSRQEYKVDKLILSSFANWRNDKPLSTSFLITAFL